MMILLMLRLLGRKIFTQLDTYHPTDYLPNQIVYYLPLRRELLL